ncbi:hypothetical protein Tco_1438366 [Tanacetum coccineum]
MHWRYFDVDLTVRKLVMNHLGQLLRNFRRKLRQTYILPNQNTLSKLNEVPTKSKKEIEPDEEPARGTLWLKGRVNKDGEYPDDEIRSVGDKLKETEDKIKEGTLNVDHGTDAMTIVLGKEKGGYTRGVGSGVTYKRYFDLPRSRQASDERILLLQSQLDNERRERQEKELLIQNLSNKMSQTEGMVTKLKNQLAAHGGQSQSMSTQLTPPNVSPVDINPINSSADKEGGTTIFGCENDASIQKSNGLATLEKEMETRWKYCSILIFQSSNPPGLSTGSFSAATIGEDTASMSSLTIDLPQGQGGIRATGLVISRIYKVFNGRFHDEKKEIVCLCIQDHDGGVNERMLQDHVVFIHYLNVAGSYSNEGLIRQGNRLAI